MAIPAATSPPGNSRSTETMAQIAPTPDSSCLKWKAVQPITVKTVAMKLDRNIYAGIVCIKE